MTVQKGVNLVPQTNVNGNWKKQQIVKGKGWRLGGRTKLGISKTKKFITKKE